MAVETEDKQIKEELQKAYDGQKRLAERPFSIKPRKAYIHTLQKEI